MRPRPPRDGALTDSDAVTAPGAGPRRWVRGRCRRAGCQATPQREREREREGEGEGEREREGEREDPSSEGSSDLQCRIPQLFEHGLSFEHGVEGYYGRDGDQHWDDSTSSDSFPRPSRRRHIIIDHHLQITNDTQCKSCVCSRAYG